MTHDYPQSCAGYEPSPPADGRIRYSSDSAAQNGTKNRYTCPRSDTSHACSSPDCAPVTGTSRSTMPRLCSVRSLPGTAVTGTCNAAAICPALRLPAGDDLDHRKIRADFRHLATQQEHRLIVQHAAAIEHIRFDRLEDVAAVIEQLDVFRYAAVTAYRSTSSRIPRPGKNSP